MGEPKITSIRYWYTSSKPRVKPKIGDVKYFKGAGLKKGWYVRQIERCTFGPGKGALVCTRNGYRYEWVKMVPQPDPPSEVTA